MVFGYNVAKALATVVEHRDLDVVELWSGVGSVALAAFGLKVAVFDKNRLPGETEATEDILTHVGFLLALSLVMRLRAGGLLTMAPVCSSWIFLCKKQTQRTASNGYVGNLDSKSVRDGNTMADVAALFYTVARARDVCAVIENPPSSTLFQYAPIRDATSDSDSVTCPRCVYSREPFGKRFGKKFKFVATAPWICTLASQCRCPGRLHQKTVKERIVNGVRKVWGDPKLLAESGSYPPALGRALVQAWMQRGTVQGPRSKVKRARSTTTALIPKAHGPRSAIQGSRSMVPGSKVKAQRTRSKVPRSMVPSSKVEARVPKPKSKPTCTVQGPSWCRLSLHADELSCEGERDMSSDAGRQPAWMSCSLDD